MEREKLFAAKDAACSAVLAVGDKLRSVFGKVDHVLKDDLSVVTELDKWAESEIKQSLRKFDSSIGFLGEEYGEAGNKKRRWLIDPIDGTEHFIRGIPCCGSMIALVDEGEVVIGVINNFVTKELFWAVKGGGAWCNDEQLAVSERPFDRALIDLGLKREDDSGDGILGKVKDGGASVVRFYSSAFNGGLIASGKIEGRLSTHGLGGPWDHAPVAILVEEAGGTVTHGDGSAYDYLRIDSIIAAAPDIHKQLLKIIKESQT